MLSLVAALALTTSAAAPIPRDSKPAEIIVGVWRLVKSERQLPPGFQATVEFRKGGALQMNLAGPGELKIDLPGTWKLDGDKLTIVQKSPKGDEKSEVMTIKTLTDTEMVTVDEKGKTEEFKKDK